MRIIFVFTIMHLFVFSAWAQAGWVDDNFNDNSQNTNLWTNMIVEEDEGEAKGKLDFFEQNQRLEWTTASGWTDNSDNSCGYGSKWNFILDQDFEVKADFHYDHNAAFSSDEGGVYFGFLNPLNPGNYAAISARNHGINGNIYSAQGLSVSETTWGRELISGQLSARYSALEDQLYLSAPEGNAVIIPGFKSLGINELSVGLGGWSGGAKLNSGDAYLDNFQVTKGHITPEPLSCVLFLSGGAFLALNRRRNRKNKYF